LAKSGLKHIDVGAELTKTEWESEESHEILHGSSFPSSPVERQLFYRDDEHKWYIYDGSAWVWLGGGGGGMSVHGNEYHDPDFASEAALSSHATAATGVHGVGGSTVESAAGSQAKVDAHKDLTTGVHGVGAGTIAKVADIAVDSNLSAAAQDAITKKHTQLCEAADFTKLDGIEAGADVTANHAPQAHKASHQDGGSDEVSIEGLAGSPAQKAQASGLASLNASSKVAQQPASVTDHLTGTPADGETTKAPTSDWAYDHNAAKGAHHSNVITLTFIIDGAGSAITTGQKGHLEIPFACTITGWTILADQSGSIVVDVWKDTYANFPPTVADTIAGSEKPTLSSAQKNQDLTLTTWTTSVAAGDILAFNVDSVATVTRVTISIRAEKN
jgi:hypothetical protein